MKKYFILFTGAFFLLTVFASCFRDHDISVSISDNEDVYRMSAKFNRHKTRAVNRLLNDRLGLHHSVSFKKPLIDREITLEEGSTFHITSYPGRLKIKFDKTENSEDAYNEVKELCEEIKQRLAEGQNEE